MSVDPARLTAVPLFADLTDDERAAVAAKLEERTVDVGDHLSNGGGAGYFFFVIESGSAAVDPRRRGARRASAPATSSARPRSSRRGRRTATVTTTAPTKLFAMFGADFAKLVPTSLSCTRRSTTRSRRVSPELSLYAGAQFARREPLGHDLHQTQRPRFSPMMSPASASALVWWLTVGWDLPSGSRRSHEQTSPARRPG